jgi:hypothetical protein
MRFVNQKMITTIAATVIGLSGPISGVAAPVSETKAEPAQLAPIQGTELARITLTEKAFHRLDIQTMQLTLDATGRLIAPYTSILYDLNGNPWVYTAPQLLTFVRYPVVVFTIHGDQALLKDGPPAGTHVVTVGVPELYGIEKGVGE